MSSEDQFEELADTLGNADYSYNEFDSSDEAVTCIKRSTPVETVAEHLIKAGYRTTERVTEFGTVINRGAAFLTPPAESLEEFKERYVYEGFWILGERDPIITRTFLRCDPEPSEPVLHEEVTK